MVVEEEIMLLAEEEEEEEEEEGMEVAIGTGFSSGGDERGPEADEGIPLEA